MVELLLPSFILPALQLRHAVFTMPSTSHSAFCLGCHFPHFLPSIDSHLFHLLSYLAGRKEAGTSSRSSHISSIPTTFTWRTVPSSVTWTRCSRSRRLQPPGSSSDAPGSGENINQAIKQVRAGKLGMDTGELRQNEIKKVKLLDNFFCELCNHMPLL